MNHNKIKAIHFLFIKQVIKIYKAGDQSSETTIEN